jgi:transcriptional regulator with XRE-family HTH domain
MHDVDYATASSEQIERALCERLESIRLTRNVTQAQLARQAGVSLRTISRMAAGEGVTLDTLIRVMTALGIQQRLAALLPDPSVRPMERVSALGRERRRARPRTGQATATEWTWADDEDASDDG